MTSGTVRRLSPRGVTAHCNRPNMKLAAKASAATAIDAAITPFRK